MDSLFSNIKKNLKQNKQQKLLHNQKLNQDKINALLETATSVAICGPDCQKQKKTEELRQKMMDSQTNLKTAPIQYEESRKNYYVYSEGNAYYDNILEKELNINAEKIVKELGNNFNESLSSAITMNQYLNIAIDNTNYSEELLDSYIKKNEELTLMLMNNQGDILTNDRKTFYEKLGLDRLKLWYKFWWYIYYILIFIFILCCFLVPTTMSKILLILLTVLLVFYPFYIDFILRLLFIFFFFFFK